MPYEKVFLFTWFYSYSPEVHLKRISEKNEEAAVNTFYRFVNQEQIDYCEVAEITKEHTIIG